MLLRSRDIINLLVIDFIKANEFKHESLKSEIIFLTNQQSHLGDVYNYASIFQHILRLKKISKVTMVLPKKYIEIVKMFSEVSYIIQPEGKLWNSFGHARAIYLPRKGQLLYGVFKNIAITMRLLLLTIIGPMQTSLREATPAKIIELILGLTTSVQLKNLNFAPPDRIFFPEQDEISRIFIQKKLIEGKTVVVFPESGGGNSNYVSHFESIIEYIEGKGFKVVVNSLKEDKSYTINSWNIPIKLIPSVCKTAGYVVSLRSGICDLLAHIEVNRMIIYGTYPWFYEFDRVRTPLNPPLQLVIDEKFDEEILTSLRVFLAMPALK